MSTSNLMLPLDLTGSASSNLVPNEAHAIGTAATRAFPLNYGLFFQNSAVVVDAATGVTLTPNTQYYCAEMDVENSLKTGEAIYNVIIIVDQTVSASVLVTYRALGGVNSLSSVATQSAIANLDLDATALTWSQVIDVPHDFPPGPHVHQAGDVFGLEYITRALYLLADGVAQGQGAAQAALLQYAEDVVAELQNYIAQAGTLLTAHTSNFNNPHQTTANEIGAYSTEQTVANIAAETTARQAGDAAVNSALTLHINNHNNPHEITPAQLGAFTEAQSDTAMQAMKTAVMTNISNNESTQNAHIVNYQNPHQVTAAQVGTWTTPQITAAISTAQTNLQQQVTAFQTALQAHTTNTNNPHGDTAASVGTWTYASIVSNITTPYASHVNNGNNPHGDVYTNIVTSNVDSSGVYSATTMNNAINSAYAAYINEVASFNGTISSHTSNGSNPHGDNVSNTGGAYTAGQLQTAINQLQGPGGSAAAAINYLASIHN